MAQAVASGRLAVRPVSERLEDVARRLRAIEQRLNMLKAQVARYARKVEGARDA